VEAYLAAAAATGEDVWIDRAAQMTRRVLDFARERSWRLPEHFDAAWQPLPDHNRDRPDDPVRPYGSTIGHWLEWSRLVLQVRAALESRGPVADDWLRDAAGLFDAAVREGWHVDGQPGFVFTVDWDGSPVVRQRLHWVLCEALGAATVLHQVTGEESYRDRWHEWWAYAEEHLLDREHGSWHHELSPDNRPAATIRPGKADLYHAVQATLLPRVRVGPALATQLRAAVPVEETS